ncbi:hypothetical protein DL96DRAFT_1529114 [Flagelloscypha sp. PMI_526]|nr:hypothetical protein DL96DRAFT_1529114 [Flagelloscypha sp. PMI_526]
MLSSDSHEDPEAPLRAHIRSILLEYCMEHLTVDYLDWTENVSAQLLSMWSKVPEHDPNALLLPPDPWSTLAKIYQLDRLVAYDEILETDKNGH